MNTIEASQTMQFPSSTSTVRVRLVDTTGVMVVNAKSLFEPVQPGHETLNIYVAAFLIEHVPSGEQVMFDLGIRKDYWNLPAVLQSRLSEVIPSLRVDKDVTDILQDSGIALNDISTIIWSHYHWDHIGNTAIFPHSTKLVVGPGFKSRSNILPGFPLAPNSPVEAKVFDQRPLKEIDFSGTGLSIGGFPAYDFFGDGSFYLLDTPGHCIGHMCGLARTTPSPNASFVLLGGDICHFAGIFRPNIHMPLPDPMPLCSLFTDHHPRRAMAELGDGSRTPFYLVSNDACSAHVDPKLAQRSVNSLAAFDSHPDVMVCLAHDEDLIKHLPTLNNNPSDDLNSWKSRGFKEKIRWLWLNRLPQDGKPGQKPAVEGFWRNGQPWPSAKAELRNRAREAFANYGL
ncbi:metallo-beta-lactamase superfamily protein [Aspergillus bombycis]|uniref:Metallo-beta-lactamase superfamily protein n=1 Tax=Aspergillus bombycis TaxID=109264 RepID=A0A1F8A6N2_9EURO|nr:metallo-beta-lactamase superfamily protein [Aspergillus bombycis]OGM47386.1 metallo-beta-lactamase superfamily protein [Aspergillus bombycis]